MRDRVFSMSGWGFMLGAGVCALLAVLVAAPNDVFADDPSCSDQCPMCATDPNSLDCQTCLAGCMSLAVNCDFCTCMASTGTCADDFCSGVANCSTGCNCVNGMGSSCKCVTK
jgi:hypothetical protein